MRNRTNILLALSCAIIILCAVLPVQAQIGFQSKLYTPPLFLSSYKEQPDWFSAAIYPQSHLFLSQKLKFTPRAVYSSHESNSIRFETDYYARGREKYSLIPLSVDASQYTSYRSRELYMNGLRDSFNSSIVDVEKRKKRSGLGLYVELPKRFEKIFGEGTAGLKVSGYKKVSFAGQSRWNDDAISTGGIPQSKFPTLKMEQIDRFDITGTIGTKITVKVSQDSQTDIPLANRIQIRYKGDDDDILKVIEAGNTTLSLPNTKFVGYSSRIRGLFGIKAEAQVGNLRVIGIASQEKGSSERTTFSATGQEDADYIRDYEYAERRVFDLGLPGEMQPDDKIINLRLYESTTRVDEEEYNDYANLFVNVLDTTKDLDQSFYSGQGLPDIQVKLIEENLYTLFTEGGQHYVVFNNSRSRSNHIACYMQVLRNDVDTLEFGILNKEIIIDQSTYNVHYLKLLYRTDQTKNYKTWDLMWRNCYDVPKGSNIEDIDLKIFKGLPGSEGRSTSKEQQEDNSGSLHYYLEILGLDLENKSGAPIPDQIVDEKYDIFKPELGLLIFPHRTPFNTDTTYLVGENRTEPLNLKIPELYEYSSFTEKSENSQYYIQLTTSTRGSIIRLNKANIIEGSERITVNGKLLTKGQDYNIQYDFGQVTLTSDEALDPNADIKIDYEYAPFFAVQKKSLLGVRAEYEWSKDLKFGTTFLYKSDKAQERKPKVGQETARTVIFDADLSLKLHPNFLTKAVNALPLIETETESNMSISAEIAQSHPNPNVDDIAYVDDFESALDNLSLGSNRTIWKHASTPLSLEDLDYSKGQMLWHNPYSRVPTEQIYDRETEVGGATWKTFRMRFTPQNFKYDVDTTFVDDTVITSIDTVSTTRTKSWGGIIQGFGKRVDDNRAQLFEVRLKVDRLSPDSTVTDYKGLGKIHFDFGYIDEDLNGNGAADSEDNPPRGDNDKYVTNLEDVGMDGVPDEEEPGYNPITNPDPNGDNWFSFNDQLGKCPLPGGCEGITSEDPNFYDYLNGTEGNISDAGVRERPDKESFGTFNQIDSYFSYVLDLVNHPDSFLVPGTENEYGWRTYRIPIRDPEALDAIVTSDPSNQPEWSEIDHVRVWIEADEYMEDPISVEVADWYFVQMSWQDTVIYSPLSDLRTKFVAAPISEDVDASFNPPPGVEAYEDPTTNVREVQKALKLSFTDLNHNDTCLATKDLLTVDRYSGYRKMEMFVWGDTSLARSDDIEAVKFFFRIGRDNENYYEYHTDVYPGWDERNFVDFDFNEVTALKDSAQKELDKGLEVDVSNDKYRVFGNPNINEIRFFAAGVVNTDTSSISGDIWIDELRVTEVRKDVGTAGRVTVSGNMADFINYNFSLESRDPYFRGLSSATRGGSQNNLGSGRHETSLSSSVTVNLQKLLPRSWNASLPVTLAYSKSIQTPLLRNNSDIVLPEAVQKEEQRISESKSFSVSARFNKKTKNPLFSVLLNRLNTRFSYRRNDQKSVDFPYNFGENIDVNADYNIGIKKAPKLPIFFWLKSIPILKKASESKLSIYPETWTMTGRYNRNITVTDDINFQRRSSVKRNFTGSVRIGYKIFENLTTSFNYDTRHDLTDLDRVIVSFSNLKLGLQTRYSQNFSLSYDPKLLSFFSTSFSFKSNYTDDFEKSNDSRRSTLSRNSSVTGKFNHQVLLGKEGVGSDRKFRGRRGVGRRKNVKEEEENDKDKKPFYEPVLKGLRLLTGWIDPISYGYTETYNNSLPGMAVRPGLKYRFGFLDEAGVPRVDDPRTQKSTDGKSFDLSSGFKFLSGISTTVKYRKSTTSDRVKVNSRRYEDISTSWPDLSIRIQKFNNLPLIQKYVNKFIDIFSPRTGYSRSIIEKRDIDGDFATSRSISKNYNPLLQVNFKLFRSLSLTSSISRNISIKENLSSLDGSLVSTTTTTKNTFGLSTKYSFTSPHGLSIPLFGKIKFKSKVDLSMDVKYNTSITANDLVEGKDNETSNKSDISFSPNIAYTFSQQIKGGLSMVWKDSKDRTRTSHYREVKIWTEIRF